MIFLSGVLPPRNVVRFFEDIIPGFWGRWIGAAEWALREIDADVGGDTTITSWHRSQSKNRRVRGLPDSQHLVGLALDIETQDLNEAADRFRQAGFIAVPFRPLHLHVQTFPAGLLREVGVLDALGIREASI